MRLGSGLPSQIKYFRTILRLSQSWVADQLGINRTTYNQFERGKGSITYEHLLTLSSIFRTTLDSLVEQDKRGTTLNKVLTAEVPFRLDVPTREADDEDRLEILRFFIQINDQIDEAPDEDESLKVAEESDGIGSSVYEGVQYCLSETKDQAGEMLDIYSFIMQLGIKLLWGGFSKLAGAYLRKGIKNGGTELEGYGIAVNCAHPIERQRFSAAHELGHHILGHEGKIGSYIRISNEQTERDANIFAAELLMSERLVSRAYKSISDDPDVRSDCDLADAIYLMSKQLQVSFSALCHRLEHFRILNRSQKAELLETKVRGLEQKWEKSGGQQPFDPSIVERQHSLLMRTSELYQCLEDQEELGPAGPNDLRLLQERCYVEYIMQNRGAKILNSIEVFQKVTELVNSRFPIYN